MLSAQALERTSSAYRRGYRDGGYVGERADHGYRPGTFAAYDYDEGYRAGENDAKWSRVRHGGS